MDGEEAGGLQRHPSKNVKEGEDASRHVFKVPEPKKSLLGMLFFIRNVIAFLLLYMSKRIATN